MVQRDARVRMVLLTKVRWTYQDVVIHSFYILPYVEMK